jgi:hypothetical protein
MAMTADGRATTARPTYKLGDFLPEQREVEVNGVKHMAWVATNNRYPRRIKAAIDRARFDYLGRVKAITERAEGLQVTDEAYARAVLEAPVAYNDFLTTVFMLVCPTMDEDTAEMIDAETIETFLTELGVIEPKAFHTVDIDSGEGEVADTASSPLTRDISPADSHTATRDTP